jgi:hypothetical protein
MPTSQEEIVTAFLKGYIEGRDKTLRLVLYLYGALIVIMLIWFSIMEYNIVTIMHSFDAWNEYKANAQKVLDLNEKAVKQWRAQSGVSDTTGNQNGTQKK